MAIPFNLPTDEETEEDYRRLDQLLLDLYEVLRQILLRRRIQRAATVPRHFPTAPATPAPQPSPPAPSDLPDLIPASVARKPPVPPPRRRRRHAKQHSVTVPRGCALVHQPQQQQGPSYVNVGIELRQIAEEFRSTQIINGEEKRRKEIKASSLFSLLVPAPLTGSIWTTVIILVGWRILAKHR